MNTSMTKFLPCPTEPAATCQHLLSVTADTTASCVTIESQPGQLLATVQCSHSNHTTNSNEPLMISLSQLTTRGRMFRERPRPTHHISLEAQEDHNRAGMFYIIIQRVSINIPVVKRIRPPEYTVHVHCLNGDSMATSPQPVQFCVKHNNLTAKYNTQRQEFTVETATPYFTNVPQTYYVQYNHDAANNFDGLLFNMEIRSYETSVNEQESSAAFNITDTVISAQDILENSRLCSPSSVNLPFRTDNIIKNSRLCSPFSANLPFEIGKNVVSNVPGLIAVDVQLLFHSKKAEREKFAVQPVYDLVLLVRPEKKHVGYAAMKITIIVQPSKEKRILA